MGQLKKYAAKAAQRPNPLSRYLQIRDNDGPALFIGKSLVDGFFRDDVGAAAAALSYYLLFSFFPFLVFLNTLIARFNIQIDQALTNMAHFLPAEVIDIASLYLEHLGQIDTKALSITGLVLAVYSVSRAVNAINKAVNRAYRSEKNNAFPISYILSVIFTVVLFVAITLSVVLITVSGDLLTFVSGYIPLPLFLVNLWDLLRWSAIVAFMLFTLAGLYYFLPCVKVKFRSVLPGTFFAALGFLISSWGLSLYVSHVARYSVIYGSLGVVVIFMLWLFLAGTVIIMGAHINAAAEQWRARKKRGK